MRILVAIVVIGIGSVAGAAPYRIRAIGPNMMVHTIGPVVPKKQARSYFMRPPHNPIFDGYSGGRRAPRARVTGGRYNPPSREYQGEPLIVYNPFVKPKVEKPEKLDLYLIFGTSDPIGYWD